MLDYRHLKYQNISFAFLIDCSIQMILIKMHLIAQIFIK